MVMLVLSVLMALALGFGAVQELVVRGIQNGEMRSLVIGVLGTLVTVVALWAVIALWKRNANARSLAFIAAGSVLAFHVYNALPPHRYVGMLALLLAIALAAMLLAAGLKARRLTLNHS
jgi:hypothetical protein